ncbi:hypothetical protein HPP92_005919 [Vanilla planifolia]|uniref:Uncharacterized protein n=1 Tax=Vanilla planifolia TaxID=51239 RepID=A0A835VDM1_VANPL|nr:hypothetical protein HPP92_005919 [Vanilla planifolia]
MREDIVFDNRTKPCKIYQQNLGFRANGKNGNPSKAKSSSYWGSQIAKGRVSDKRNKPQAIVPEKKPPPDGAVDSTQNNHFIQYPSLRLKGLFLVTFPCSATAVQVHPHAFDSQMVRSPSSSDIFTELDHLRSLLRESKDRELALQSELRICKNNPRILELEWVLDRKTYEIESMITRINALETEKSGLSEQLASLSSALESPGNSGPEGCQNPLFDVSTEIKPSFYRNLEIEVLELRRTNKELQLQKEKLSNQTGFNRIPTCFPC